MSRPKYRIGAEADGTFTGFVLADMSGNLEAARAQFS